MSEQDRSGPTTQQPFASEFAIVEEVVRSRASEFEERGFALTGVTAEGSPKLLPSRMFHFANPRASLGLALSFFPAKPGLNGGFNVLLVKPGNRKLDVKEYLVSRHGGHTAQFLTYSESTTDLHEFAHAAVRMITGLLDDELKPVVEGRAWDETPIDWQGYR